jgi:hypothetical protein
MKNQLRRFRVWFYARAMSTYYRMAVEYVDMQLYEQAEQMWNKGDAARDQWLKAASQDHPSNFKPINRNWVEALQDGGYENQ